VIMYLLAGVALSRDASSTRATDTSASRGSQVDDPASSEALR
jgi:hypothetical protein